MTWLRRRLLTALLALPGAAAIPAWAGEDGRTYRIFMILWRGETGAEQGFRAQLHASGLKVEYIVRDADQQAERIPAFVEEARGLKVDLVYTWGTTVTVEVAKLLHDIPIVFTVVSWPHKAGLAGPDNLSHRHITGTSHTVPIDLQVRAIQAYRRFERLAVVYNPIEANSIATVQSLRDQAERERFTLIEEAVPLDADGRPRVDDLPNLIARVSLREPQFLFLPPDSFVGAHAEVITREALRRHLPTFSSTEPPLRDADALFGLVAHYSAVGRLAGRKAEEVLKGRPPGEVPIERLSRFSLIVQMRVARQLGFYPPVAMFGYAEVLP